MNEPDAATAAFVAAAERVLSDTFGGPVRLGEPESLRDKYRNRVLRCPVTQAPAGVPASVIVKASVGEGNDTYDPHKDTLGGTAWRFFNEWAGTRFLNERAATDAPLCARLLGGNAVAGLLVLEDLGTGPSLADSLQGDDPEQARAALFAYAASLGRLHARTLGGEADWRRVRNAVGGREMIREREGVRWIRENVEPFVKNCAALGVPLANGFEDEVAAVRQTFDASNGPFDAFAPCDTCPDNNRIEEGGRLRFFDFEFGGFRHALLDAAYLHLPFPTCWCVNRLPKDLPDELETVYRRELASSCPEARSEAVFHAAMNQAVAYWTVASVSWSIKDALQENGTWGISTVRQRHPFRLENFADRADRFGHLPALSATCRALAAHLRELWPEDDTAMPLYPPFRDAGAQADRSAPVTFG